MTTKKKAKKEPKKGTELVVSEKPVAIVEEKDHVGESLILQYLDAFGFSYLTKAEKMQFIGIAKAFQLNPFKREIHCVPYMTTVKNPVTGEWKKEKERKLSIITGYEVYINRAERSGRLDGWNVKIVDEGTPKCRAVVTIHRKGWGHPMEHEVFLREFQKETKAWKEMPFFMLKKVAIAQGMRLAFPDAVGGMPYTGDEIMGDIIEADAHSEDVGSIPAETPEELAEKTRAQAEAREKLDGLSSAVKEGFRILGYTDKTMWAFCNKFGWDDRRIMSEINKIVDVREASKQEQSK